MTDGEDWLFRPILRKNPMYSYVQLTDGSLDLADVALCNEALEVELENESRLNDALRPPDG